MDQNKLKLLIDVLGTLISRINSRKIRPNIGKLIIREQSHCKIDNSITHVIKGFCKVAPKIIKLF